MDQSEGNYFLAPRKQKRSGRRIRRVSPKRRVRNALYQTIRQQFLSEHPYCQWAILEAGNKEADVIARGGVIIWPDGSKDRCPPSTEIHHKRGRVGELLTNPEFFMAVCAFGHRAIHHYTKISYEKGYMLSR